MKLAAASRQFILHWGEMGTAGASTVPSHSSTRFLYLSPESLTAEDIAETLSVARSNVSTSLKELQNWNLVQIDSRIGDRRDYFQTSSDVWQLFLDRRRAASRTRDPSNPLHAAALCRRGPGRTASPARRPQRASPPCRLS